MLCAFEFDLLFKFIVTGIKGLIKVFLFNSSVTHCIFIYFVHFDHQNMLIAIFLIRKVHFHRTYPRITQ